MSLEVVRRINGSGKVDGYLKDWEREHPLTDDEQFTPEPDPAIQEAVNTVWERIMDCQPLLETVLTMPIDQIGRFKAKLYQDLAEWKEENL